MGVELWWVVVFLLAAAEDARLARAASDASGWTLPAAKRSEKVCGLEAKLKWPNDLLIDTKGTWKKCAGILTEMSGQMERTEWVVIGAGLNVNNSISKSLSTIARLFMRYPAKSGRELNFSKIS